MMNRVHHWLCSSRLWARSVERSYLPTALTGVALGDDVLELGPGFGATTRALARRCPRLTALELDPSYAEHVRRLLGDVVRVVLGDATRMPFDEAAFSGVTCFTMLHHIPSPALQDALFAEAHRVLRPGGVFAGADSTTSLPFRLLHIGDIMVLVDPDTLGRRLEAAGFRDVRVARMMGAFRFHATKPEHSTAS